MNLFLRKKAMAVAVNTGYRPENSIVLLRQPPSEVGRFSLSLNISTTVNVSPAEALRKVNRFVQHEVSYLMRGDSPNLLVADRIYWHVPVLLAFPSYGVLGQVGSINVDVETGALSVGDQTIEEIKQRAQDLADRFTPQTAPAG